MQPRPADCHPLIVRREAPHNQRMKLTQSKHAFGVLVFRSLSAAPLASHKEAIPHNLVIVGNDKSDAFYLCFLLDYGMLRHLHLHQKGYPISPFSRAPYILCLARFLLIPRNLSLHGPRKTRILKSVTSYISCQILAVELRYDQ